MGCEVGQPPKGAHRLATLQNKAAKALANVMGISVCVSAPDKTIKEDHLADLLKRLPKIRGKRGTLPNRRRR